MAVNATAVWRVRPSGSNTNGGGFDCAISPAATGTNGSFSGTTFTDTVAAAFSAGMVGSSINISGVGQYKITAFINSTNITLGSGNPALTLSGGLLWTIGSGQDYSQQNAAQATGTNGTASATTTFTDATFGAFSASHVGNAIHITGGGLTAGWYFITGPGTGGYPNNVALDRSPGTGSAASWSLGGAWADFFTNTTIATAAIVAGNTIYLLGSATPNPASYVYDYTIANAGTYASLVVGTSSARITYANDPATLGYKAPPDTTGGMPTIKTDGSITAAAYLIFAGIWFINSNNVTAGGAGRMLAGNPTMVFGCVHDQFGFATEMVGGCTVQAYGCEAFSSQTGTNNVNAQVFECASGSIVMNCNIHDTKTNGIYTGTGFLTVVNNIIAKNAGNGIQIDSAGGAWLNVIGNTIDGNLLNGISLSVTSYLAQSTICNNIISNHTVAGKFGIAVLAGTQGPNDLARAFIDYNIFYNNTADIKVLSYGPHDTHGGANPYLGQTTENYTLA